MLFGTFKIRKFRDSCDVNVSLTYKTQHLSPTDDSVLLPCCGKILLSVHRGFVIKSHPMKATLTCSAVEPCKGTNGMAWSTQFVNSTVQ